MTEKNTLKQLFSIPVIVAALGYFVDIYDLLLFTIVKAPSMRGSFEKSGIAEVLHCAGKSTPQARHPHHLPRAE